MRRRGFVACWFRRPASCESAASAKKSCDDRAAFWQPRHGGKQRAHVQTECDRQCGPSNLCSQRSSPSSGSEGSSYPSTTMRMTQSPKSRRPRSSSAAHIQRAHRGLRCLHPHLMACGVVQRRCSQASSRAEKPMSHEQRSREVWSSSSGGEPKSRGRLSLPQHFTSTRRPLSSSRPAHPCLSRCSARCIGSATPRPLAACRTRMRADLQRCSGIRQARRHARDSFGLNGCERSAGSSVSTAARGRSARRYLSTSHSAQIPRRPGTLSPLCHARIQHVDLRARPGRHRELGRLRLGPESRACSTKVRTSPDRMAGGRRSGGRAIHRQKGARARARDLGDGVWGREGRVALCRMRPRRPSGR
jgi:hypothetical protein